MRSIAQHEAERMREALKTIANFYNPAATADGGQAAAKLARETLEEVNLLYQNEIDSQSKGKRS